MIPQLVVTTKPVDDIDSLVGLAPADSSRLLAWVQGGEGLLGWGEAVSQALVGPERFSRAQRWWSRLVAAAKIHDDVCHPGTGPVVFASFGFDAQPASSLLVVPEYLLGVRAGKAWLTTVGVGREAPEPDLGQVLCRSNPVGPGLTKAGPVGSGLTDSGLTDSGLTKTVIPRVANVAGTGRIEWLDDPERVAQWRDSVATAIGRITAGELDKVVLARNVLARAENPINAGALLTSLEKAYPECWAFSVGGLVGATPELLVRRDADLVSSRVLAGTVRSGDDIGEAGRLAEKLLGSDKDLSEHEYAVASVAAVLAAYCTDLDVPSAPRILRLANVQHLTTDIAGMLAAPTSVLALAASLHPTAAVCGTPTERAYRLIHELESMDRDRYAGPIGWMDANGDGEFGIALRCGQIDPADPHSIRLFAGCGIVAGSQPAAEVVESEAKLQPMRIALGAGRE